MEEVELRRRMKAIVVPTSDVEVRRMLRKLAAPVTLFGEREVSVWWSCSGGSEFMCTEEHVKHNLATGHFCVLPPASDGASGAPAENVGFR